MREGVGQIGGVYMLRRTLRWLGMALFALVASAAVGLATWDAGADVPHRGDLASLGAYLRETVESTAPSEHWLRMTAVHGSRPAKPADFWALKVWLASFAIDASNVGQLSLAGPSLSWRFPYVSPVMPVVSGDAGRRREFWLDVGGTGAPVYATIVERDGQPPAVWVGARSLPDCYFDPDLDADGDIDADDVRRASEGLSQFGQLSDGLP